MPYIPQDKRPNLNTENLHPQNAGELNFVISQICAQYLKDKGLKYQHLNDIMGALEGVKAELYRRVAVPYEDKKIQENGDIDYPDSE